MWTVMLASWTTGILATLFVLMCMFMIMVILIQKPKGGGLSGAFGGAGGGSAVFGARTGDALTWITVGFFVLFLSLGIGLVYATRAEHVPSDEPPAAGTTDPGTAPTAPAIPADTSTTPVPVPAPTPQPTPTPAPAPAPADGTTPPTNTPTPPSEPNP